MKRNFTAALVACLLAGAAHAQSWPDRPIRFIAAFPAGGGVDIVARAVAPALSARLGQPIVVENRTGAAGALGSAAVAKAPADGYTVLITSNPSITIVAAEEQKRGYDPLKDLRPVVKATVAPTVIVTAVEQPYRTMAELIAAAKARPGVVGFATPGQGSTQHFEMEIAKELLGIDLVHVPYRGTSLFMTDVLSGQVPVGVTATPASTRYIQGGRLNGLAVLSPRRSSVLPEIPTLRELTRVDFDGVPSWFGFLVPAGTPDAIVRRLESDILAVLRDPEIRAKFAPLGMDVVAEDSASFQKSNEAETRLLRSVMKRVGITSTQ